MKSFKVLTYILLTQMIAHKLIASPLEVRSLASSKEDGEIIVDVINIARQAAANNGRLRKDACEAATPIARNNAISACRYHNRHFGKVLDTACYTIQEARGLLRTGCVIECRVSCEVTQFVSNAQLQRQQQAQEDAKQRIAEEQKQIAAREAARQAQIAEQQRAAAEFDRIRCQGHDSLVRKPGKKCLTTARREFKSYENASERLRGAIDQVTKLVWYYNVKKPVTYWEASRYCEAMGARLPTQEEFEGLVIAKADIEVMGMLFAESLPWTADGSGYQIPGLAAVWGMLAFNPELQEFEAYNPEKNSYKPFFGGESKPMAAVCVENTQPN